MAVTTDKKVKIVTDSALCLPQEIIDTYNIRLVPQIIIFGDREYRDRIDLHARDFYTLLAQADEIPSTSAPSPSDFSEAFTEVSADASAIVCILVTAGFSSMGVQAAAEAKETFDAIPVEIIDSRTAVGAYGFITLAAAKAAASGGNVQEVVDAAESMKQRVNMVATLNTLKYLAKGGRIGKAAHWGSSILNIKPLISVPTSTGVLEPIERIRTRKKSLARLLEIVEESVPAYKELHASIDHAGVPEDAAFLKSELESRFECAELFINDWAPVAGAHCGPGVIGISYYAGE